MFRRIIFYCFQEQLQQINKMTTRRTQLQRRIQDSHKTQLLDAVSTDSSLSPRSPSNHCQKHPNKEKLQLCRKFMENGTCPYNHKCKFAHGSHELRRNQEVNFRYKTKQCGTFFKLGSCHYGDRCNFLHIRKQNDRTSNQKQVIWENFRQILQQSKTSSRLMQVLSLTD